MPSSKVSGETKNALLTPLLIGSAIVLGGASASASWSSFAFQILAVLILIIGVVRARGGTFAFSRELMWLGWGFLALILVQLAPLPPDLWASLPGRALVSDSLGLADISLFGLPISMEPGSTISTVLAAVPLLALLALLAGSAKLPIMQVSLVVVLLGLASWILAVLQAVGGVDSPLYFHSITNRGLGVGFFANANHLATLLVICVPLVAALAVTVAEQRGLPRHYSLVAVVLASGLAALGITLTGSVAGISLLPLAVITSLFIVPASGKTRALGILGALGVGIGAILISVGVLGTSFDDDDLSRTGIWRTTLMGIQEFWPIGSGLGTFQTFYPMFENPASVTGRYVNHAHNDYLQLLFEAGLPGALLIVAFVGWWAWRSIKVWRKTTGVVSVWHRAATIVVGLGLAHSIADYPLRTPALMVIIVFYAILLTTKQDDSVGLRASEAGSRA